MRKRSTEEIINAVKRYQEGNTSQKKEAKNLEGVSGSVAVHEKWNTLAVLCCNINPAF